MILLSVQSKHLQSLCYYDAANLSPLSLPLNQQQYSVRLYTTDVRVANSTNLNIASRVSFGRIYLARLYTPAEISSEGYIVNNKNPTTALVTRPSNRYLCSNKATHRLVHYKDRAVNCLLVTPWTILTQVKTSSHKYNVIIVATKSRACTNSVYQVFSPSSIAWVRG